MIYIYKDPYPPFFQLAKIISSELKVENEITDDFSKDGLWIVFFTSYQRHLNILKNKKYIVVQTENIEESGFFRGAGLRDKYIKFLSQSVFVWDYTSNFKLGYSKIYELEYEESKDIDVLFYGAMNPRRKHILDQIPKKVMLTGGDESGYYPNLWNYIRCAKIVLNINFYERSDTNVVRICPLLTNRIFFITEKTIEPEHNNRTEYVVADYEKLPELCKYYLENPLERLKFIESGYNYIKNSPIILPEIKIL